MLFDTQSITGIVAIIFLVLLARYGWRKLPQSRLRQSSPNSWDDLFETAPVGYLELDRDGIVRRVNRQECKLHGKKAEEILGKHFAELVPPEQRERSRREITGKLHESVPLVPYQHKLPRPDGGTLTIEVHETLLRDERGDVHGLRLATIDVSDRVQVEQQAFAAAAELKAIFSAFPDLFLWLDDNGTVLDCKGGNASDPLLAPQTFLGRRLDAALPGEAAQALMEAAVQARARNSVRVVEYTDNDQAYEARVLPLYWNQSIAVVRNITDRKTAQHRLERYAQELVKKNEELEEALTTARKATQLKSRFLANTSHEIRTPMNGVVGMTELLLGTPLNAEQREYADAIKQSARSLLAVINDILDLSKIEAGKLHLERIPFDLKTTVEEVISSFALRARGQGLDFTASLPDIMAQRVVGDPGRLGQVLTNLLGNAVKFTERGKVAVATEMVGQTADAITVRFTVQDTGLGISREDQQRLFQSFTQVHGADSRRYGGTGLGLAIAKQLVDLLGGEIGVNSEPGRGSTFWFTAVFDKDKSRSAAESRAPAAPPIVTSPDRRSRVLLAEDNKINQRIAVRLLQRLGFETDAVENGREAVEAVAKRDYDLILMDCQMPEVDGFEATAMIRNRERGRRHTPICALTANAMEGDRERCLAAGMDDYISKPLNVADLTRCVDKWTRSAVGVSSLP